MTTEFMTETEAAKLLCLHRGTLANYRSQGRGPQYVKVEGRIIYSRRVLETYLRDNTRSGR